MSFAHYFTAGMTPTTCLCLSTYTQPNHSLNLNWILVTDHKTFLSGHRKSEPLLLSNPCMEKSGLNNILAQAERKVTPNSQLSWQTAFQLDKWNNLPSKTQVQSSFSMSAHKDLSLSAAALYCPPLKPLQLHCKDKPPKADSEVSSGQAEVMIQGTSQLMLSTIPTLLSPQLRQTRYIEHIRGEKTHKSI